jgi:2,3-bisphosphoglycerate-independent phosphoglycerate mutase
MSALKLTESCIAAINRGIYSLIVINYANPDMVGHTGNFEAAVKAIEAIDASLGRVYDALRSVGGEALITADHGNAEQMRGKETGQAHTAHTSNVVPLLYIGRPARLEDGALADVAPTMLNLMGLTPPPEMSGHSLVEFAPDDSPVHTDVTEEAEA